jgi:hypothetical protein
MAKNLFWLASYPKSGNTWLRAFIGALLGQELISEDGRFNKFSSQCSDRAVFAQVFGKDTAPATEGTLSWRLPYQRALSARFGASQHFVKTHCRYRGPEGAPLFASDVSAQAVLVVRNPVDVAASLTNHFGVDANTAIAILNNPEAMMAKNSARNFDTPLGDWTQFHREWTGETDIPLSVLRYEDLSADPVAHFGTFAARVFNIRDVDIIGRAINAASFETLQARESRFGFDEKPGTAPRFFWKGQPFHGLEMFDEGQRERIWRAHGEAARALGYDYDGKMVSVMPMDSDAL